MKAEVQLNGEPGADQRAMSTIGRVALTALLMFGISLALVYGYRLAAGTGGFFTLIFEPLFIVLGTAAGAGLGIRPARLPWQQTAFAALLSTLGLILYARFEASFPGPWVPGVAGLVLDFRTALVYLVIGTAGIFFLPLFDPAVRRTGPAPALWKVALTAFALMLLALLADYLIGGGSFFGLAALIFGSFASAALAGLGLILTLLNLRDAGAWLGGLAILLELFTVAAWGLLGTPWFP